VFVSVRATAVTALNNRKLHFDVKPYQSIFNLRFLDLDAN
jgi:hypothetical protein